MGIDIMLSTAFSLELLKATLLKILGFEQNLESIIVSYYVPDSKLPSSCQLLVVASEVKGQMCQLLELYFQHGYDADVDMMHLVAKLCSELECSSLISDDDVNPYSRIEIRADGQAQKVLLDISALDDNGEYVILSGS
jgi:hypothetical protein